MNIDLFKREHVHILADVAKLRGLVRSGVVEHAELITSLLASSHEMVRRHLLAEDRILHVALARAPDPATVQTSRQFQKEMGDLAAVYAAFIERWDLAARIADDAQAFCDEATVVFDALHQRVQRENQELYPLAERLGEGAEA